MGWLGVCRHCRTTSTAMELICPELGSFQDSASSPHSRLDCMESTAQSLPATCGYTAMISGALLANPAATVTPNKAGSVQTQMPLTDKVHE